MGQMYKVFTEKGVIIFTEFEENIQNNSAQYKNFFVCEYNNMMTYESLDEVNSLKMIFESEFPEKSMHAFFNKHKILIAAGGLVMNKNGEFLIILRNGVWDLPKGKKEANEDIRTTAIREVEEECGISGVKIVQQLTTTYHTYQTKDKERILKPSHWFLMRYNLDENLQPQYDEGITEVKWINKEQLKKMKSQTYPAIADVIDTYFEVKH